MWAFEFEDMPQALAINDKIYTKKKQKESIKIAKQGPPPQHVGPPWQKKKYYKTKIFLPSLSSLLLV